MTESYTNNNQDPDPQNGENTSSLDDAFNPERLRLSQNFGDAIGVKKILTTIPIRKPDRQSFIRVHPDPAYRLPTAVLELAEEGETYLVEPDLVPNLSGELKSKILFTAIDRQGVVFIWPVRLPEAGGRRNPWNASAMQGAEMAMEKWVRVSANLNLGAYDLGVPCGPLPEPEWPNLPFRELLRIAFEDKFIRSLDHPVVKRLRGLR